MIFQQADSCGLLEMKGWPESQGNHCKGDLRTPTLDSRKRTVVKAGSANGPPCSFSCPWDENTNPEGPASYKGLQIPWETSHLANSRTILEGTPKKLNPCHRLLCALSPMHCLPKSGPNIGTQKTACLQAAKGHTPCHFVGSSSKGTPHPGPQRLQPHPKRETWPPDCSQVVLPLARSRWRLLRLATFVHQRQGHELDLEARARATTGVHWQQVQTVCH